MSNPEAFNFTYSAAQQQEVEKIRKEYLPQEEDKLEHLRALHRSVSKKATIWSISAGVLGTLILGTGMSLCMTDISLFPVETAMAIGIPTGLAGLILVAAAYPIYHRILKKERQRIAPEILKLTQELLGQ